MNEEALLWVLTEEQEFKYLEKKAEIGVREKIKGKQKGEQQQQEIMKKWHKMRDDDTFQGKSCLIIGFVIILFAFLLSIVLGISVFSLENVISLTMGGKILVWTIFVGVFVMILGLCGVGHV